MRAAGWVRSPPAQFGGLAHGTCPRRSSSGPRERPHHRGGHALKAWRAHLCRPWLPPPWCAGPGYWPDGHRRRPWRSGYPPCQTLAGRRQGGGLSLPVAHTPLLPMSARNNHLGPIKAQSGASSRRSWDHRPAWQDLSGKWPFTASIWAATAMADPLPAGRLIRAFIEKKNGETP